MAVSALAAWSTHCDLPQGDDDLPPTGVEGLERESGLRLLAPPNVRRIGAVIPVTVEATFPEGTSEQTRYCVRLAGAPGELLFPFGDRCDNLPRSLLGEGGEAGAGTAGGAAGESSGGANGGAVADPDSLLHVTQSCIAPTATVKEQVTGTLHAAYFATGGEPTATLFGALFDNASCTGEPLTSTAVLLDLRHPSQDGSEGGANAGGADGMGGSAPTDAGTSMGGSSGGGTGGSAGDAGSTGDGGSAGKGGTGAAGGDEPSAGQGGGG